MSPPLKRGVIEPTDSKTGSVIVVLLKVAIFGNLSRTLSENLLFFCTMRELPKQMLAFGEKVTFASKLISRHSTGNFTISPYHD